ncbi:MAG: peptidoglycan editing factor PgeF [Nocardioidaceae bacterium]
MFAYVESLAGVRVAFTDRHGGVSAGSWKSLNLGTSNGDDPARVATNLGRVAARLDVAPAAVIRMSQVHGDQVHVVTAQLDQAGGGEVPVGDALVTASPEVTLLVRAADCVPLVLADAAAGLVGVAHAGRRGLMQGIVSRTVAALRELGAEQLTGWIGPRVCGRCYEVPDQMRDDVSALVPQARAVTSWGTPALDIGAGVRAQLEQLDVDVIDVATRLGPGVACTVENTDLFSYRRQGRSSGRLGGLVRLIP